MITLFLVLLILAPQLWIKPLIGIHVDYYLYPIWFIFLVLRGKVHRVWEFKSQDFFFLAMIVWIIASALINQPNALTNTTIINYIKFFILFRFTVASLDHIDQMHRVIFVMLVLSYVLVLESIQHKFSMDGLGWAGQPLAWADEGVLKATGSGRTRWIGPFDGPGVFCVLFTNALPFTLQFLDKYYSFSKKFWGVVLAVPLLVAIYFTGSRGGFFASIIIFLAYLLAFQKISIRKTIFAATLVSSIFVMAPAYLTSTHDSHKSAQYRIDMWGEGLEMTKYNPVFGIGKGNFLRYTGQLIAHNSAIEIMGETGLPGFFLWLSVIYMSFKNIFLFWKSTDNHQEQNFAKALGICIIGYIASSMFVTLEYETFYFILALGTASGKIANVPIHFTKKDFATILAAMFGFILLIKAVVSVYF